MTSRWERLLELEKKPVPLIEHLLDEVARLLATDLRTWPLPILELDLQAAAGFEVLLQPQAPRPPPQVFEQAFVVARWELERELEASSDYFRNRRYLAQGLTEADRTAILLVSRWLVEQLLALREHTHSKVSRPMLVDCLQRTHRRFLQQPSGA
jgi:hypothetical protein